MSRILEAVLNSLWLAVAVTAAVWLLLKLTPRINAATRYAMWWAVLVVVMLLPIATGLRRSSDERLPAVTFLGHSSRSIRVRAVMAVSRNSTPPARASSLGQPPVSHTVNVGRWPAVIFGAWTLTTLLLLARIGWSYCHLRSMKRRAHVASDELQSHFAGWLRASRIRRKVRLLVSNEIGSPIAVGFLHPAVLLPESLVEQFTRPDLDHVLLHELAHVARRDDWTNLWARLASALLAFHPVAVWVVQRIDREREIACDDWVVAQTGAARPYATSLARLFELCSVRHRTLLASGMAEGSSRLGDRVEMLLQGDRVFTPRPSVLRVAGLAAGLLGCVAAGVRLPRWIVFSQAPARVRAAQARTTMPVVLAADTKGSFLAALVASGYGDLTVDEIIELKDHGISGGFLMGMSQAGWGKIAPRELIELHAQGVEPEYLRAMRGVGLQDPVIRDVISLKQHGVRPDYAGNIQACGMSRYTADEVIALASHGVPPDLLCALREAGFQQSSTREIIEAKNQGLRPEHLREAGKFGGRLTLQQIVKLKQAGVI